MFTVKRKRVYGIWLVLALVFSGSLLPLAGCEDSHNLSNGETFFLVFQSQGKQLKVHVLDDDLLHLEWSGPEGLTNSEKAIPKSPSIYKLDYSGPGFFATYPNGRIETGELALQVDLVTLSLTVFEKINNGENYLTALSPVQNNGMSNSMAMDASGFSNVYGLGEEFLVPGEANGGWAGRKRSPGNRYGNKMVAFNGGPTDGGFNGNAQFPIMYALGEGKNFALYMDEPRAITWDFTAAPWQVSSTGSAARFFLMSGPDLPDLRRDYMELCGRPPVPPKKIFGMWVSQYGYRDWNEVQDNLASLRQAAFPVDGFVLDLFWYGGILDSSPESQMCSLRWDLANFPDPALNIADFAAQGIGILAVEESYLSEGLAEYAPLADMGALVRQTRDGPPVSMAYWWGQGGMLDWTWDEAADFWFDYRRLPLIRDGLLGHWTDLGEPENFDAGAWYFGLDGLSGNTHADVCNYYNFKWLESIARGYERNSLAQRPFMLSRSGVAGIQRFGAAMWSGDIAARLSSLRTHFNAQMHMSFSGMDYFGADIGGFWRKSLDGDLDDLYTRWFANGMAFDVPGRPHTFNLEKDNEFSPEKIGDVAANLANVRRRYRISPYVYSIAHMAHLRGDPVFPPLVYHYQEDPATRNLGDHKMIGPFLLARACAEYGETESDVYLPAGTWINFNTGQWRESQGEVVENEPLYVNGLYTIPLFARAGALIPEMEVDKDTLNILGLRTDGFTDQNLLVRVFASKEPTSFVLYEDDGWSTEYLDGQVRSTPIGQILEEGRACVTVYPGQGDYQGAPDQRNNQVVLILPAKTVNGVTLNGAALSQRANLEEFNSNDSGWYLENASTIRAKSGILPILEVKEFFFSLI